METLLTSSHQNSGMTTFKALENPQRVILCGKSVLEFNVIFPEFWLGLETISKITSLGTWELMVELEDFQNKSYIAVYHRFRVESSPLYRLSISGYDTAASSLADSLNGGNEKHNGQAFSTRDRDNDKWVKNCAEQYLGAWWYDSCHNSNLNGYNYNRGDLPHESPRYYAKGIIWKNEANVAEQDHYFSWPKAEMKIRKKGC